MYKDWQQEFKWLQYKFSNRAFRGATSAEKMFSSEALSLYKKLLLLTVRFVMMLCLKLAGKSILVSYSGQNIVFKIIMTRIWIV